MKRKFTYVCQEHFAALRDSEYFPASPQWGVCDICKVTRRETAMWPEFIARVTQAEVDEYVKEYRPWT